MTRPPLPPNTPCRKDGCSEPRALTTTGRPRMYCLTHQREYAAAKAAEYRKRKRGMKGKWVIVSNGTAMRYAGGVLVQEVVLRNKALHRHTAAVLKMQGYRVVVQDERE